MYRLNERISYTITARRKGIDTMKKIIYGYARISTMKRAEVKP